MHHEQHSRGPWAVNGEGMQIAEIHTRGVDLTITAPEMSSFDVAAESEAAANARLLASAPRLFQLAKAMVKLESSPVVKSILPPALMEAFKDEVRKVEGR